MVGRATVLVPHCVVNPVQLIVEFHEQAAAGHQQAGLAHPGRDVAQPGVAQAPTRMGASGLLISKVTSPVSAAAA